MTAFGDTPSIGLSDVEPNELVRRALDGCSDSFTELADRFRPRLLILLRYKMSGAHSEAEDLAQETLAKAFQQLGQFDSRYRFSTWLYTIAIRLACDYARNQRRKPHHVSLEEAGTVAKESPARELRESQEAVDSIWMTAQRVLNESQYTAMWLRYAEEMSAPEVAKVMGRTGIGVRVLLHRSRAILLAELARQESAGHANGNKTGDK